MARPRVVHLEGGTVSLTGFSKDVAEQLIAHIKLFGQDKPIVVPAEVKITKPIAPSVIEYVPERKQATSSEFSNKAIGVYFNKDKSDFSVVTVKYNFITKEALVDKVEPVGSIERDACNNFKKAAMLLKFV